MDSRCSDTMQRCWCMVIVFDLDDTLYDEIDFVKSGFAAVADYIGGNRELHFSWMWETFLKNGSGTIFNQLLETFEIHLTLQELIDVYRYHTPNIFLSEDVKNLLTVAHSIGKTALITDGNAQTQMSKYNILELDQWIDFPVFTALYKTSKPDTLPFKMVMEHFTEEKKFIYIADNPKKDFFAPNELHWLTIRYKNPCGIYRDILSNATYETTSCLAIIPFIQNYFLKK